MLDVIKYEQLEGEVLTLGDMNTRTSTESDYTENTISSFLRSEAL